MNSPEEVRTMADRPKSPSSMSLASDGSVERHVDFKKKESLNSKSKKMDRPEVPSRKPKMSGGSVERLIDFKDAKPLGDKRSGSHSLMSLCSEISTSTSRTEHEDTISMTSLPSAADSGLSMSSSWSRDIAWNIARQEHRPVSRYAKAGDVACDLCQERKLKAYKSCITCLASFCERHVKDHYTLPAMQSHVLVEVTEQISMISEEAQQNIIVKKMQMENQSLMQENQNLKEEKTAMMLGNLVLKEENVALKEENTAVKEENMVLKEENMAVQKEIKTLKQMICKQKLPGHICKGKIPAAANVVWDPASAHHALILSDDGKQVELGEKKAAQRFDKWECVLASEGLSSGRHYWEVEVNREFITGVTSQSSQWKGKFSFYPSKGFWCLCHYRKSFTALDELTKHLDIDTLPPLLGVCIDVDEKWVTFYNAKTKALIYTFRQMNFKDQEKIYPIFSTLANQGTA